MLPQEIDGRKPCSCSAFRQGIRVVALLSSFRHRRERPLTSRTQPVVRRSYAVGIFFLAALVVSVICLAHASPPDPTWIPGIYDRGDFDDAVLALLSIDGVTISPSAAPGSDGTWQVLPSPAGSRSEERRVGIHCSG